jgi:hypothetical protein
MRRNHDVQQSVVGSAGCSSPVGVPALGGQLPFTTVDLNIRLDANVGQG